MSIISFVTWMFTVSVLWLVHHFGRLLTVHRREVIFTGYFQTNFHKWGVIRKLRSSTLDSSRSSRIYSEEAQRKVFCVRQRFIGYLWIGKHIEESHTLASSLLSHFHSKELGNFLGFRSTTKGYSCSIPDQITYFSASETVSRVS